MFQFGDSDTYWYLAKTIAHGESYQYGSPNSKIFRAPLYPMFLAPAASLLPQGERYSWFAIMAARLSGCLAGVLAIYLVVLLTIRMVDQEYSSNGEDIRTQWRSHLCGLFSALLAIVYPGAIGMSVFILSEAVFCPLLLATLLLSQRSVSNIESGKLGGARTSIFYSGFMSGLACLARPSWSLWPIFLSGYLLCVLCKANRKTPELAMVSAIRQRLSVWVWLCFLFIIGTSAAMGPWWIRNYAVTGKWVPTTLQVGASLYDGWHSGASGSSDENMEFVLEYASVQSNEDREFENAGKPLESTYEHRLNRRLFDAAMEWAIKNPSDAIWLGLVKLLKTWSPFPSAKEIGGNAVKWMEAIGYLAIAFFAALGMWKTRNWTGAWLPSLPCLYFAILHMFFIGSVRYRQPAILVLCCLAGIGLAAIWINMIRSGDHKVNFDGSKVATDAPTAGTH